MSSGHFVHRFRLIARAFGDWESAPPRAMVFGNKQEIPGLTGGALDSHEALPGPIYLQGSEAGHVSFRNITITPAK